MTYSIVGATARHACSMGMERRLAAVLSADVQGYSRLMYEDETATIRTLTAYRGLMAALIRQYRGRVVDDPGDNLLAEFPSVVEAVQCAVTIQRTLATRNAALPPQRQMVFRMGLHVGDIVGEQERIYGTAVNLAARLERVAEGGGLCISDTVYDHVMTRLPLEYSALGVWIGQGTPRSGTSLSCPDRTDSEATHPACQGTARPRARGRVPGVWSEPLCGTLDDTLGDGQGHPTTLRAGESGLEGSNPAPILAVTDRASLADTLILDCPGWLSHDRVFQHSELVNGNPYDIAGLEPDFWIHP